MEKDIDVCGVTVHYDETGPDSGAPVLLMHGWGCDHTTVRSIAKILEPAMHVYNVDLPGHGKSNEPPSPWGVDNFTRLAEEFCRSLKITDPVLIGHSFGGRIALLMSSRNPISRMVLVDAAGIKPRRSLSYYCKVYSFKVGKRLLPAVLGKNLGRKIIDRWRSKGGSSDYANSSPMMRAVMSRCVNEDLKHVMPSIKASTLLVWGDKDTATPIADAKYMERHIPDAGLACFDGCGHYSFLDDPIRFRAVMQEFFKKDLQHAPIS